MKSVKMLSTVFGVFVILGAWGTGVAQGPYVENTIPGQNEINVPKDPVISVEFSHPMDTSSFQFNSSFIVQGSKTGVHVGFFDFDGALQIATFDNLAPPFAWGEEVTVTLTTELASATSFPLVMNYVFNFTIEAARGPSQFLGTASYPVGFIPYGLYAAELNGSGADIDLVATGYPDLVVILENQGGGVFLTADTAISGTLPHAVVGFDEQLNGQVDLATANWTDNNISIIRNNGGLNFTALYTKTVGMTPAHITAADLNCDGYKDLAVANWNSNNVSVLYNLIDGGFTNATNYATGLAPRHVAAADIDHDWDIDLVVANQAGPSLTILENEGNGILFHSGEIPVLPNPMSVVIANLDGVGLPDYATTSYTTSSVLVLLRDASGSIDSAAYPVAPTPRNMVATDIDGDGDLDLATNNYDSSKVSVLLNRGDGTFSRYMPYSTGESPYNIAGADFDGDGDMDLATSNYYGEDITIMEPLPLVIVMYMDPDNLINMLIVDPLGRRLGFDEFSTYYKEIPSGEYYQPLRTDSAYILEPIEGEYIIEFHPQLLKNNVTTYSAIIKTDGSLEAVIVEDATADKQLYTYYYEVAEGYHYRNGDANRDEEINIGDGVYVINYVFKGGAQPDPIYAGDANCDKSVNVSDAVYIINFVFKGGSKPCCCELCGDACQ